MNKVNVKIVTIRKQNLKWTNHLDQSLEEQKKNME